MFPIQFQDDVNFNYHLYLWIIIRKLNIKFRDMMTLEEARKQLLHQIELKLCQIFPANNNAYKELHEFYDFVSSLHIDHFLFDWYAIKGGNIKIDYIDGEVRISKLDEGIQYEPTYITKDDIGILISKAFKKRNQN